MSTLVFKAFNCATLTTSVSSVPAATFVICRVYAESPTDNAPVELSHTEDTLSKFSFILPVIGSYPILPPFVVELELPPRAIPPSTVTVAAFPTAVAFSFSTSA